MVASMSSRSVLNIGLPAGMVRRLRILAINDRPGPQKVSVAMIWFSEFCGQLFAPLGAVLPGHHRGDPHEKMARPAAHSLGKRVALDQLRCVRVRSLTVGKVIE